MLLKELVEGFKSKSITKAKLMELYGLHEKSIQRKLNQAGFKWNKKTATYDYTGNNESVMNTDIKTIFGIESNNVKKESNSTSNSTSIDNSKVKGDIDAIDILLQGKENNSTRTYRGFYFDNDVLEIIDNANSGKKSELINLALRKVFSEKGLL